MHDSSFPRFFRRRALSIRSKVEKSPPPPPPPRESRPRRQLWSRRRENLEGNGGCYPDTASFRYIFLRARRERDERGGRRTADSTRDPYDNGRVPKVSWFFSPYVFPPSPPWNHRPDFFASSFTSASFSAVGSLFISTFPCQGLLPSSRKTKKVSNSLSSGSIPNRTAPTV